MKSLLVILIGILVFSSCGKLGKEGIISGDVLIPSDEIFRPWPVTSIKPGAKLLFKGSRKMTNLEKYVEVTGEILSANRMNDELWLTVDDHNQHLFYVLDIKTLELKDIIETGIYRPTKSTRIDDKTIAVQSALFGLFIYDIDKLEVRKTLQHLPKTSQILVLDEKVIVQGRRDVIRIYNKADFEIISYLGTGLVDHSTSMYNYDSEYFYYLYSVDKKPFLKRVPRIDISEENVETFPLEGLSAKKSITVLDDLMFVIQDKKLYQSNLSNTEFSFVKDFNFDKVIHMSTNSVHDLIYVIVGFDDHKWQRELVVMNKDGEVLLQCELEHNSNRVIKL